MTTAVLAYDAGPRRGLGHRRRMEALAEALGKFDLACHLVPVTDLAVTLRDGPGLVVIDSYDERADGADLGRGRPVVAIDDLERNLAVDLLVDPNPGGDPSRRTAAREVLYGPEYALLQLPESPEPQPITPRVHRVLVTTGGADLTGFGQNVAHRLIATRPDLEVVLVVGPWSVSGPLPGVITVHRPNGLAADLADADLVVTAGGVTLVEALALGRPTVAMAMVDNQRRAVEGATAASAALGAMTMDLSADDADRFVEMVVSLVDDPVSRARLSAAATSYVDGRGAARVAEAICGLI